MCMQVTRRLLNFEGMQVVRHVAREFLALEQQYKLRYNQQYKERPTLASAAVQSVAGGRWLSTATTVGVEE